MIVIDIGSATHGDDESINALINEFHPKELWGYDPAAEPDQFVIGDTLVTLTKAAVWTYDGEIGFRIGGLGGMVHERGPMVPCLDITKIVDAALALDYEVAVKFDCEGAEYELVPRLVNAGLDQRIKLALIEWHCEDCLMGIWNQDMHRDGCPTDKQAWINRRDAMRDSLRCEVREWLL